MQAHFETNMSAKEDDILRLKSLLSAGQSITEGATLQVASGTISHEVQMRVQNA